MRNGEQILIVICPSEARYVNLGLINILFFFQTAGQDISKTDDKPVVENKRKKISFEHKKLKSSNKDRHGGNLCSVL